NLTADQERLRAMVAGMVEGVVAVDEDDCVTFSNHAAREILGIEREASDQPLSELSHIAGIDALLTAARQSDSAAQCELEMSVTDEDAVVRAQAHRFNDQDSVGVVVVLQDVSEVRRLEHIRRDFVANVSHELKTPLTSIRGYVETLLDGAIDDDDHNVRFLEKIENNVLRLNHLVTDLLSLARIESQQGRLPLQPVDLHALLEEALRRHEPSALAREQRLVVEAPAGALRVLGDREALTQVIDNLIDNALKYTPDTGAVHVRVQQSEGSTLLEVADDGVGIPQEDQARIFERFYRVDKARSRAVGGTGLGLSIVKHLVGAMQGTIELQSEPGEGSAFRIVLAAA
ncbi:MAG: ATP-binding protein, partial [Planctomycetota bacterium]